MNNEIKKVGIDTHCQFFLKVKIDLKFMDA